VDAWAPPFRNRRATKCRNRFQASKIGTLFLPPYFFGRIPR
jgi:hypothetical protein